MSSKWWEKFLHSPFGSEDTAGEWLLPRLREYRKDVEPSPPPPTLEEQTALSDLDRLMKKDFTETEVRFLAYATLI